MLAHSGIILFKKGTKQAGLHFYAGLSPYEFPRRLYQFLMLLKDTNFSESFNNYFDAINVVSVESIINPIDQKILSKINENDTKYDSMNTDLLLDKTVKANKIITNNVQYNEVDHLVYVTLKLFKDYKITGINDVFFNGDAINEKS